MRYMFVYFVIYLVIGIEGKPIVNLSPSVLFLGNTVCPNFFGAGNNCDSLGYGKPYEAKAYEFPFHANLLQKLEGGKFDSFCGGSLIHPMWILTAAHCLQLDNTSPPMEKNDLRVALGSNLRNATGATIVSIDHYAIHPIYRKTNGLTHDIALIKLEKPANFTPNIQAIVLCKKEENFRDKTAYLTGFGLINDIRRRPDKLRRATLHISDPYKCRLKNLYELCASSTVSEGKACRGDSGGPLFIRKAGKFVQIGVTSRLAMLPVCRLSFNHSIYTKVSPFIQWITNVTKIDFYTYIPSNS